MATRKTEEEKKRTLLRYINAHKEEYFRDRSPEFIDRFNAKDLAKQRTCIASWKVAVRKNMETKGRTKSANAATKVIKHLQFVNELLTKNEFDETHYRLIVSHFKTLSNTIDNYFEKQKEIKKQRLEYELKRIQDELDSLN